MKVRILPFSAYWLTGQEYAYRQYVTAAGAGVRSVTRRIRAAWGRYSAVSRCRAATVPAAITSAWSRSGSERT